VPNHAEFVVVVNERPVERIIAVFPWWVGSPQKEGGAEFSIHHAGASALSEERFQQALAKIEEKAVVHASVISLQSPIDQKSPLYRRLSEAGFSISQTDKNYVVPGDSMKARYMSVYEKMKHRIPPGWVVQSIRGHSARDVWKVASEHRLISFHQFESCWDRSNKEHFEEKYSSVVLVDGKIIAVWLVSRKSSSELHVHVDAVSRSHSSQSHLATMMMRNFMSVNCEQDFPRVFTFRADGKVHKQTQNTAIRCGGKELPDRHLMSKTIIRS